MGMEHPGGSGKHTGDHRRNGAHGGQDGVRFERVAGRRVGEI